MSTILETIKQRLGIFYSDPLKNGEISQMIAGAKAFMLNSGVSPEKLTVGAEPADVIEAIVIWCKMAQNTDPVETRLNPVLVAIVAQLRNTERVAS